MARRNDHTREEIKEMAISAGTQIIEQYGFNNFSIRKVAKKLGYTVGTLYNVFENYNDLLFHINSRSIDNITELIQCNISDEMENIEALKAMGRCYLEYASTNFNNWIALVEYQRPDKDNIPEWYQKKVAEVFSDSIKFIIPLVNGDIEKAQNVSRVLWGAVHGICILGLTKRIGKDNIDLLYKKSDDLIENYLNGLLKSGKN